MTVAAAVPRRPLKDAGPGVQGGLSPLAPVDGAASMLLYLDGHPTGWSSPFPGPRFSYYFFKNRYNETFPGQTAAFRHVSH